MTPVKEVRVTQITSSRFRLQWLPHLDAIHYYLFYGQDIDLQGWYKDNDLGLDPFNPSGSIRIGVGNTYEFDFRFNTGLPYFDGTDFYNDKINPGGVLYFGIRAQNSNGELSEMVIVKCPDTL